MKQVFISHISEEAEVAAKLKVALARDFLGLLDVFVSSDAESIAAGEEWLGSIELALKDSALLLILCSPTSINRPWINFEAGAAWMRKIPLIPICHLGLTPRDLMMPLSLRQGIVLSDPDGIRRLYERIANTLATNLPPAPFDELTTELTDVARAEKEPPASPQLRRERDIRERLVEALQHQRYKWRSLERIAASAGTSEELAADLLRSDANVRFSKGESGNVIVGLRSRVGN